MNYATQNIIFWAVVWISVIFLHELGHYMAFRFNGYKPSIKFKWYGINIGENIKYRVKVVQMIICLYCGIYLGIIPLFLVSNTVDIVPFFIYFAMCGIDIINLIVIMTTKEVKKDSTMADFAYIQLKKLQDDLTKNGY